MAKSCAWQQFLKFLLEGRKAQRWFWNISSLWQKPPDTPVIQEMSNSHQGIKNQRYKPSIKGNENQEDMKVVVGNCCFLKKEIALRRMRILTKQNHARGSRESNTQIYFRFVTLVLCRIRCPNAVKQGGIWKSHTLALQWHGVCFSPFLKSQRSTKLLSSSKDFNTADSGQTSHWILSICSLHHKGDEQIFLFLFNYSLIFLITVWGCCWWQVVVCAIWI